MPQSSVVKFEGNSIACPPRRRVGCPSPHVSPRPLDFDLTTSAGRMILTPPFTRQTRSPRMPGPRSCTELLVAMVGFDTVNASLSGRSDPELPLSTYLE